MFLDALTYGYANARVKAMKGRLIAESELRRMAQSTTLGEFVSALERTDYRSELSNLSIIYRDLDLVDKALGANQARTHSKLLGFVPKEALEVFNAFAGRWDVYNLKTILLGKHLGYSREAIEKLMQPSGRLEKKDLDKLNAQDSVEKVVYFLGGTHYGAALMEPLKEYEKSKNISLLAAELEKQYYLNVAKSARKSGVEWNTLRSLLKFEVDSKNIITLMRHVKAGSGSFNLEDSLISGGTINTELLTSLKGGDIQAIVSTLRKRVDLSEPQRKYEADGSLVHFEIELESRLYRRALRAFRLSTISIGSIVGFLYRKEAEAGNLRKILRGIEFNVPKEKIEATLVM